MDKQELKQILQKFHFSSHDANDIIIGIEELNPEGDEPILVLPNFPKIKTILQNDPGIDILVESELWLITYWGNPDPNNNLFDFLEENSLIPLFANGFTYETLLENYKKCEHKL